VKFKNFETGYKNLYSNENIVLNIGKPISFSRFNVTATESLQKRKTLSRKSRGWVWLFRVDVMSGI